MKENMFKTVLISLALRTLDKYLVSKIRLEELRNYVKGLLDDLGRLVALLTDKNPQDVEQLSKFWAENKKNLIKDGLPVAKAIIVKEISDPMVRDLILELIAVYQEESSSNGRVIV